MEFGKLLKEIRLSRGYGLSKFAEIIDLTASMYSDIEKHKGMPNEKVLNKIFGILKCSPLEQEYLNRYLDNFEYVENDILDEKVLAEIYKILDRTKTMFSSDDIVEAVEKLDIESEKRNKFVDSILNNK